MFKSLIKDSAVYGIADLVSKILNFAIFPILANLLTLKEYGVLALVTTIAMLINNFFQCGLNYSVQRFYIEKEYEKSTVVSTGYAALITLGMTFVGIFLALSFHYREVIFDRFHLKWSWIALALLSNLFMQLYLYSLDVLRVHFSPWKFTFLSLSQNVLVIFLTLYFVTQHQMGVQGYLLSSTISYFILIPPSIWAIRKDITKIINFSLCWEMLKFGFPYIFTGLAFWVVGSLDRWMLEELSTLQEVGVYSIAFRLITILLFISNAFGLAWAPHAYKSYHANPKHPEFFSRLMSVIFFLFVVLGGSLSLFSLEFFMLTTPEPYWQASSIMVYLAMGLAYYVTSEVTRICFSLEKKTYHITIAWTISAITNFTFNYIMIPQYGALGASMATFISYFICTTYCLLTSQKIHPLPLEKGKLAVCYLSMVAIFAFNYWVEMVPWSWNLFSMKIAFIATLISVGFGLKVISFKEILQSKEAT